MGSRIAAVVFLLGLLFASPMLIAADFDFFQLVLMWPGAYCAQSGCCVPTTGTPADDFFVRGLWAYSATNQTALTKCSKTPFYINELDPLIPGIYEYWSNIKCPSNDGKSSWRSAWKTYGVCSNMTQVDYFQAALDLYGKLNVLKHLESSGIAPDYDLYKVTDIKSAIAKGIGAEPQVRCSKGPFDEFQLYELYICVDKDASTIIECPFDLGFTCSESILFHPFRDWMLQQTTAKNLGANPLKMPSSV